MKEINLPPFYVGQKVACIIDGKPLMPHNKGDEFIIKNIWWGCHCWFVDVGWVSPVTTTLKCKHCNSKLNLIKGNPFYPDAVIFTPIQENFQSISLEKVLEKETPLISVN